MTKKPSAAATAPLAMLQLRKAMWTGWKLVIMASFALCILAFIRLQSYSLSDDSGELISASANSIAISRRSRVPDRNFHGNPKIAFLFLAKKDLPLDFLWGSFFENADTANFSIYIHSEPGFVFDESTTRSTFFYNRQLKNSIKVVWGGASMIEAERLLLLEALDDPGNQRFVLLSDSCVPLYNFSYIYKYLMTSPRSFVDSFMDKKDGRYTPKMSRYIPKSKWRKGSQWIALIRKHAEVVADDEVLFPFFKKFCKRLPPIDASKLKQNRKLQKLHDCIPDEHYVQTLLEVSDECSPTIKNWTKVILKLRISLIEGPKMHGLGGELERRTVTYTVWNRSDIKKEKNWHPVTFTYGDAGPESIKKIKDISHVYYGTEFRTEWCCNNHTSVPCFLFARKFSQAAAMRLLSEEIVRGNH